MAMTDEELLLQMNILASKTDSTTNPNMVYKVSGILNKGLNPEFFTGNYTKIVNALNMLAGDTVNAVSTANAVSNTINKILVNMSSDSGAEDWNNLQSLMQQSTIVDGLTDIYSGKKAVQILGVTSDDVDKVLSVGTDDNGNLVLEAIEQIASGNASVAVEDIAYENKYVSSITNVKGALDYAINAIANNEWSGGLGGDITIGEITWDMIDDRPTVIADGLMLTSTHLELMDGGTTVSTVELTSDSDIEEIMDNINLE